MAVLQINEHSYHTNFIKHTSHKIGTHLQNKTKMNNMKIDFLDSDCNLQCEHTVNQIK